MVSKLFAFANEHNSCVNMRIARFVLFTSKVSHFFHIAQTKKQLFYFIRRFFPLRVGEERIIMYICVLLQHIHLTLSPPIPLNH